MESPMLRSLVVVGCLVFLNLGNLVLADDYLIHVKSVGYENAPEDEAEPRETTLNSLQFVAELGKPFRTRCSQPGGFVAVRGELKSVDDGQLRLKLEYRSHAE